jgi:hypothetical protein
LPGAVRKFLRLDRKRQRLFVQAWLRLAGARYDLRAKPFKELTADLTLHRPPFEPAGPGEDAVAQAEQIGWAVRTAAAYTPWNSTCLVQVLAAQRMLAERLLPGAFYLGAAPGETGAAGLDAHAWLKCGDRVITGETGHERFVVVSAFSWL